LERSALIGSHACVHAESPSSRLGLTAASMASASHFGTGPFVPICGCQSLSQSDCENTCHYVFSEGGLTSGPGSRLLMWRTYPSCAISWQLCQFVTTRGWVANQQCVLIRSGSVATEKREKRPYTSFSKKNNNRQGYMLHTVERANSWARLLFEAHRKDSKSDRAARREDRKGSLPEINLMLNYLLWWHLGPTFCWLGRFHTCRCPRLLPSDLPHSACYLSAPRAPQWAHLPPSHRL